jgi:general secretion pathway protein D
MAPSLPAPGSAPATLETSSGKGVSQAAPARATVSVVAPKTVKKNEQFRVDVQVSNAAGLYKSPFTMVYDPIFVEFLGAAEGLFLKQDGKRTTFESKVDKNTGQVTVTVARVGDAGGITGSGVLMTAMFRAKNQGPASFGFLGVNLFDSSGKVQEAIPFNTVVEVK